MFTHAKVFVVCCLLICVVGSVFGQKTLKEVEPKLAYGTVAGAVVADLPDGILLKSDGIEINKDDIEKAAQASRVAILKERLVLEKNHFYVMEKILRRKLLFKAAKDKAGDDETNEKKIIQKYLGEVLVVPEITDAEARKFYDARKAKIKGSYEQVKSNIKKYLSSQRRLPLLEKHIIELSKKATIQVSSALVKKQQEAIAGMAIAKLTKEGKPFVVDFWREGCKPCKIIKPILEELKKEYDGKVNIDFVNGWDDCILAAMYNLAAYPTQIYFNKDGSVAFTSVGALPKDELKAKIDQLIEKNK